MGYRTLLMLLAVAWVAPQVASGQLDYVYLSTGLNVPELDTGRTEFEFGDVNGDGHVDLVSIGDHGSPRFNSDEDVDLPDFATFQTVFTGAGP